MSEANGGFKVGDYIYNSWGYDQTNVDFYKIVALIGKTMVSILPVMSKQVNTGREDVTSVSVVPGDEPAEYDVILGLSRDEVKPVRKKAKDGSVVLKAGQYWARKWDGKPKYETAAGFGH